MKVHVSFDIDASKLADLAALLGGMEAGAASHLQVGTGPGAYLIEASSSAPAVTGTVVAHIATQTAQEAPQKAQETTEEDDWSDTPDAPAETATEAPAAPEAAPEPARREVRVDETVLRAKSLAELRAICESNGVPIPPKKTKDGYIKALFEHLGGNSAPAATEVAPSPEVPVTDEWADDPAAESTDGWDESTDEWDEGKHTPALDEDDLWAEDPAA